MTQSGELLTQKGAIYESVFHSREQRIISYRKYTGKIQDFSFDQEEKNADISYKMIFVLKGDASFFVSGVKVPYISLNNRQHNLIGVPKGTLLTTSNVEGEIELIVINLSAPFLNSCLPIHHPSTKNLLDADQSTLKAFSTPHLFITPEIGAILNSIENSVHTGFCMELFLESKVIELLVLQLVQVEQTATEDLPGKLKKEDIDKMNEVREILVSDFNSQHSLRTLAHMVGTNEFNLKKNFKMVFGTTVYGYLNQYKMEEAKKVLMSGQHNVSEVSSKMGYKYATHFTSAFKKYFGYLPTKIKMLLFMIDPEICLFFMAT
jgi:AraC-like DNA-binding protein